METIHHFVTHFFCCYYPKIMMFSGVGVIALVGVCRQQIVSFINNIFN
jgi:hypothetical protein